MTEKTEKIDAVVFDLDGTLLNTLSDLTDSVNFALRKHSCSEVSTDTVKRFAGNGAMRLVELCVGSKAASVSLHAITQDYLEHYEKLIAGGVGKTAPYEGILPMLDRLKKMGVKCGVVSNKPDKAVKRLCDDFFGGFMHEALGEDVKLERKPSPEMTLRLLENIGVSVKNAVLVGDSEVDLKTAENARMRFVCVSWGFRDAETLAEAGAKTIIHSPAELFERINL